MLSELVANVVIADRPNAYIYQMQSGRIAELGEWLIKRFQPDVKDFNYGLASPLTCSILQKTSCEGVLVIEDREYAININR